MERIHVAVRPRPLSSEDAKTSPWRISGNSIFIPNHSTKFEFDQIFREDCNTFQVYQACTKDIVAAAVRGFNGTVFAYGQTNSGKTHTMRGSRTEPGVIPLAVHDLFEIIQQDVDREFLLRMSYMEIYNEEINDLLVPEHRKLQIHENLERGIYVAGLREEIVASSEQVLDLVEFGESHRHIGETNMNLYSSRSHTIFRMIIESRDRSECEENGNCCDAVRVSVLNLVDLAGSERAAKTGAEGVRLKEGSHINKSLMTLGTVIKKLSEGAESQGGHVPYRDSKLTRILQPALGGNANTAMICNITLAQIHSDETKSSLQFASRALRVTNCAQVNEILTDAALLKRQKKEIEELRAKLQGSHSEHLEAEVLSLRNTLLQTELERERIALELEEEKKAQAEWEKRVKEQARKIENLSSMVLFSNRDETRDHTKKEKRRDTWCPGKLSRENLNDAYPSIPSKASARKSVKPVRDIGPLIPFEELVNESIPVVQSDKQGDDFSAAAGNSCNLPHACALLHVTNRKKVPARKKSLSMDDNELFNMSAEYEDLFLEFVAQIIMSEIQIQCLGEQLAKTNSLQSAESIDCSNYVDRICFNGDKNSSLRESEAIMIIKRLQDQIEVLKMEKSSSQHDLDNVVDLATKQNIHAQEKIEELYEELLDARETARVANEKHTSCESVNKVDVCFWSFFLNDGDLDFMINISMEVQEITSEVQNSKETVHTVVLLMDEVAKSFSALCDVFLDLKTSLSQCSAEQKLILSSYQKLNSCLRQKVSELENEKILLVNESADLQKQLQESKLHVLNSQNSMAELSEQHQLENAELLSYIQTLEKDVSCLASSTLVKEKEALRKDLEKTRTKLKETECKLKIAIQERTKLEGEKAYAEREIKRLHSQNSLLERDINKRDSLAGRRRDSVIERSSKLFDSKRPKGLAIPLEQTFQEDYKRLEVLAFESETRITSLEEQLSAALKEKEDLISFNESLASELENLTDRLNTSNSELCNLNEEISALRQLLEESNSHHEKLEKSIKMLVEEKEELAMQLTDALLQMEEEKAIWSAKEKAAAQAIEEKARLNNVQTMSLSKELLDVKNELESYREQCKVLRERLTCSKEDSHFKDKSRENSLEIDQPTNHEDTTDNAKNNELQEVSKSSIGNLSLGHDYTDNERVNMLQETNVLEGSNLSTEHTNEFQNLTEQLSVVTKERDNILIELEERRNNVMGAEHQRKHCYDELSKAQVQVEELSTKICRMEAKMHGDGVRNNKEMTKLRMRLRGTQAKLEAFRGRYKEAIDESDLMNRKYEEGAVKLKNQLASKAMEVLALKKELSAARAHHQVCS
ncbi:kinesin-like protein KIN-7O isoform X2 [Neltuma alba]|uniref:kinesin-like protein KIN-7O isoform X2 n=1 Tax=Neltuma alba TaxID=207710 RepID=UPI0010A55503|nr:kinesin-like protein KIN-7O isoform X2 [Prosopis alba]